MAIGEEIDKILKADKTLIHLDIGIGPPGFFDITRSVVIMSVFDQWASHRSYFQEAGRY